MVSNDEIDGITSLLINDNIIEMWGISEQKLHEIAMSNTERLFPAEIIDMDKVIFNLALQKMRLHDKHEISKNLYQKFSGHTYIYEDIKRYHISNKIGTFGAGVILYEDFLPNVVKKLHLENHFLYILPYSVNEIVLLASKHSIATKSLLSMIKRMYSETVNKENRLANTIYYYDYKEDRIMFLMD